MRFYPALASSSQERQSQSASIDKCGKQTHITNWTKIILDTHRFQLPFPLILSFNQSFISSRLLFFRSWLCKNTPQIINLKEPIEAVEIKTYLVMLHTNNPAPGNDSPFPICADPELGMNFFFRYEFTLQDVS
jgi:hypothetical protein